MADVVCLILCSLLLIPCGIMIADGICWLVDAIKEKNFPALVVDILCVVILIFISTLIVYLLIDSSHVCSNCKTFSFGDKYCVKCGQQFSDVGQICPTCNKVNCGDAHYCYWCGTELEVENNG